MFGIHVGNTNSSMAICKNDGHVEMVVDEGGDRVVSSFVTFTDEEVISGNTAKSYMVSKRNTTVIQNKTLLSLENKEIDLNHYHNITLKLENNEIHYCIPLAEKIKFITPQNVASIILRKLFNTAKNITNLKEENLSCVLLVPESFTQAVSEKFKIAAESAGWKVLQVINECAAAILPYSLLDYKEPSQTILVYRMGGTTCEVSVFKLLEGMLHSVGTEYRTNIGGNQFTEILTEYLAGEFFKRYNKDIKENQRSWLKLKLESEKCVHNLSVGQTTHFFIESLYNGVDFSMQISRFRFELLIQPVIYRFLEPINCLKNKLVFDDYQNINKIILCGGATIIPKLRESIINLFDTNQTQILTHVNADEVLARGAAKQAYYLNKNNVSKFLPRALKISSDDDNEDGTGILNCNLEDF